MLLITLFISSICLSAIAGMPAILTNRRNNVISTWLMIAGAISGLYVAIAVLGFGCNIYITFRHSVLSNYGILHLDTIGAFFLIPILILSSCGSIFTIKYCNKRNENSKQLQLLFGILTAFLIVLTASANTITFISAWEGMSITSFILIMTKDREYDTRHAGSIYLVSTYIGTIVIIVAFGLLYKHTGVLAFNQIISPNFAKTTNGGFIFILFLIGFGFKSGIFPLHFWLPLAHSVAPSHVSSLMSGMLIKMGILGLMRILYIMSNPPLWWGVLLVLVGICTGILGIAFAIVQSDIKKILAYCSIENIGLIFIGLGLGLIGQSMGSYPLQLLGFAGTFLHILNHSLAKGLLFLCAGSIINNTNIKDIELLGGLIRTMPLTAKLFLVGSGAICGLPFFNCFISELFIYLAALHGLQMSNSGIFVAILISLAVIGALSISCFTKTFGITFLGQSRSSLSIKNNDISKLIQIPIITLATLCIIIGILPIVIYPVISLIINTFTRYTIYIPLSSLINLKIISYILFPTLLFIYVIALWCLKNKDNNINISTWNCGYIIKSPRIQYTGSSFVNNLMLSLSLIIRPKVYWRRIIVPFPSQHKFAIHIQDFILNNSIINSSFKLCLKLLTRLHILQNGRLSLYILYIFVTLILLMVWTII